MPRQGISYEQVAAAAQTILAEKRQPTIRAVRELLQTGSVSTIQNYLRRWREEFQPLQPVSFEIPPSLAREIQKELARVASVAREDIAQRLTQTQKECETLSDAHEKIEEKNERLQAALETLRAERDNLVGRAEERAAHIAELESNLHEAQSALTAAQVEAAHVLSSAREQNERFESLRAELDDVRKELSEERRTRNDAECRLEGLSAKHQAATERLAETQLQAQRVLRERDEAREMIERQRIDAAKKSARLKRIGLSKPRRAPDVLPGSRVKKST
ncbi:MAG: DNA-binding protein [Burkholderiaceae bacterium]|nr:DNA-binding protein [Burkholderiaceae bacterium]